MHLIGHHETCGQHRPLRRASWAPAFDYYRRLGIDAVKTGYVSDAGGVQARGPDGQIRFEWHEGQVMARHHLKVVTEAAKRQIAVNAHEPIKDSGLRRTYPNWVSREGQRGMEYNAWGVPKNPPRYDTELFFTRMMAGPMDYTPGIVSLKGRGGDRHPVDRWRGSSRFMSSSIRRSQMAADLQENYEAEPVAFGFIKQVPVDWDETRVLAGEVGDYVVFARKDRGNGRLVCRRRHRRAGARRQSCRSTSCPPANATPRPSIATGRPPRAGAKGKDMVCRAPDGAARRHASTCGWLAAAGSRWH